VLPREDPRDALFTRTGARRLAELPHAAVLGTAALRRQAQALMARPDLKVVPFRGNVETRLRKLAEGQADATLLAVAGLKRLGRAEAGSVLEPEEMLPAAGQGIIAVERRSADRAAAQLLPALDDGASAAALLAERAVLAALDGSCRTPIAAYAEPTSGGRLRLRALIALPDGSRAFREEETGPAADAASLGGEVGRRLLFAAGPDFLRSVR
jgi:hydroxymethylbilane synthase